MHNDSAGEIYLINGASSSGKTAVSMALCEFLTQPTMQLRSDWFRKMFVPGHLQFLPFDEMNTGLPMKIAAAFHETIAAFATKGINVIADHSLFPGAWLAHCVTVLAPLRPMFVGLHCPLEVLRERELRRGDRQSGLAEHVQRSIHNHGVYDFEADTSVRSPSEIAREIVAAFPSCRGRAFDVLSRSDLWKLIDC
jgi:chloramphenicol 3-O phosphotransferase